MFKKPKKPKHPYIIIIPENNTCKEYKHLVYMYKSNGVKNGTFMWAWIPKRPAWSFPTIEDAQKHLDNMTLGRFIGDAQIINYKDVNVLLAEIKLKNSY